MSEFDKMERWANGVRSSGRDLVARPNFTIPNGPPVVEPPLRLGGPAPVTPGTAVATTPYRPNFTMPGNADVIGESVGGKFASTNGAATDVTPRMNNGQSQAPEAKWARAQAEARAAARAAGPAGAPVGAAPAGAGAAQPASGIRTFFTGGAPGGVGGAFKSVGGAAADVAGKGLRTAAKLAGPAAALGAIYDGFTTDTQDYEQRLGLQGNRMIEGTDGYGRDLRLGADLSTRALGIAGSVAGASGATTEAYRKRYGNETTDPTLAGDLMNRTLGVGEDVLRTWSGNDLVHKLTGGAIGFDPRNDAQPLVNPRMKTTTAQPTLRAGAPDTTRGQPRTAGGRGVVNPSVVDPDAAPPTNGLASTLAPDLPDGVRKLQQGGSTLYTNVAGDNASMFKPGTISAQNSAAADALSARYGAEARATAQAQIDGAKPQGLRARLAQQLEGKELTAKGVAALARAEELDNERENRATTNAITLRGQDIADRGHVMAAKSAREKLLYEAKKDDRTYNFEREKFGETEATSRFNRRQQATKDLHTEITSMIPPAVGPDGKPAPDTTTAARYAAGISGWMADQRKLLSKRAAAGDRQAAAALDDLDKNGVGALDDRVKRQLIQGFKINDLSAQYGSGRFNPVGGTDVYTDKPASGLRNMRNGYFGTGFGNEYEVLDAAGKPTGQRVPARAIEGDGSFVGGKARIDLRDAYR